MKRGIQIFLAAVLIFLTFLILNQDVQDQSVFEIQIGSRMLDTRKPMVAMTYDDGPRAGITDEILKVFDEHDSVATFFIVGEKVEKNAEILKEAIRLNCELGHHTYSHKDMSKLSKQELDDQLNLTQQAVYQYVDNNYMMKIARPTFGNTSAALQSYMDFPLILWSIDTRDWSHQNVDKSVAEVLMHVQDGDVILMHDDYEATLEATKILVPELIKRGYQLVSVSELFTYKQIELVPARIYKSAHEYGIIN
ncbi:MAG: polysaccharide deacetylase family protein [Erysipelotrichaceae bacterium]|nr:polysaccharide deacetylase family protein [Erysipelotrichaceae bacterium]